MFHTTPASPTRGYYTHNVDVLGFKVLKGLSFSVAVFSTSFTSVLLLFIVTVKKNVRNATNVCTRYRLEHHHCVR